MNVASSHWWSRSVGAAIAVALLAGAARAAPTINLEEPAADQIVSGIRNLRGFAFSSGAAITLVELKLNGQVIAVAPCCSDRADVKAAFPTAPLATGFSAIWNWGLVPNGPATFTLRVVDSSSAEASITRNIQVENAQDAALGAFLLNTSFTNATCTQVDKQICCNGVVLTSEAGSQTCNQFCYAWDKPSQDLALQNSVCSSPIPAPTPTAAP